MILTALITNIVSEESYMTQAILVSLLYELLIDAIKEILFVPSQVTVRWGGEKENIIHEGDLNLSLRVAIFTNPRPMQEEALFKEDTLKISRPQDPIMTKANIQNFLVSGANKLSSYLNLCVFSITIMKYTVYI